MIGKRLLAAACAVVIGAAALVTAPYAAADDTDTLKPDIVWWTFDETSGAALDASGSGYTLTPTGGSHSRGVLGGALELTGGDYALLADYTKPTATATYSAWVYMRDDTAFETILKNWGGNNYGQLELGLSKDTGMLSVQIAQADGTTRSASDSEPFAKNAWTLVTVTMDGSRFTLYKNDKAVASDSYNGTLKTSFAPLGVGVKPNDAGDAPDRDWPGFLQGKIDDVRIYSRALSAAEIGMLYATALPTELTMTKNLSKTTYKIGEGLNVTGMELTATYEDGRTAQLAAEDCVIRGFDNTAVGEQTVSLDLTIGGVTKTVTTTVTVKEGESTGAVEVNPLPLKTREATEWTRLFDRRQGWIGSDGIFSFNLNGKDTIGSADENTKTFFIFSDTLVGSVNEQTLAVSAGPMMNHSAGLLTGDEPDADSIEFYYGYKGDMTCTNLFGDNYWLMDGVVIGDCVYVTAIRVDGSWRVQSIDLIKIPIVNEQPDLANFTVVPNMPMLHWQGDYSVVFGNGIMPNTVEAGVSEEMADGYIYVYGYRMSSDYHSELLVARVLPEDFENGKKWRYWNGAEWVANIREVNNEKAVIMPNPVSNEASVTPIESGIYAGKYMAVYCRSGQNRTMEYAIADTPVGPFSEGVAFFDAPEAEDYPLRTYSYNAKAHPHLSSEGHLLVTYNVNNPDMWSATNQLYRSRWLEIDLNTLAAEPVLGDVSSHQPTSASGFIDNDSAPRYGADGGYWQHSWRDDTKGDKWLQIDLGSVKYVRRYILRNAGWGDGKASALNTRDWVFQVSLDGKTWTDVDAVNGNTADKVVRDFDEAPARYVRLYITNPSQDGTDRATVTSIEVYGTPISVKKDTRVDVARGKTVTVSGGEDTAALLVNGQYDSIRDRWMDTTSGDKWAVVDLDGSYTISKYVVRHAGVREETYLNTNAFQLQASDDGSTWRDIDEVPYNMHNVTEREVTPFTARYVRLYITKPTLSNVDVARVYSLELYSDLDPDNGWWKLDETDGTTAKDAIGGFDAQVQGDAAWSADGLTFAGTNGIAIAENYTKPTTTATYAAWVTAKELTAWGTILKNWGVDKHGQISLGLSEDGRHLEADVTQTDGTIVRVHDDAVFPVDQRVHVALTADGKTLTLYKNGVSVASAAYNGTLKATGYDALGIGAKPNDAGTAAAESSAGYWNGTIADVRVYSRALSAGELQELIGRPVEVEEIADRHVYVGDTLEDVALPATVQVTYSSGEVKQFAVTWDTAALDLTRVGVYTVKGTYNSTATCSATIHVRGAHNAPDIAWWKLNETEGDTAANAVYGGTEMSLLYGASWESGKFGNGLAFRNGFAMAADYTKPTETATYSAWIYMNDYTTYGTVLKNWGVDRHGQISLGLLESGGQMGVTFTQANGGYASVTDAKPFPLKQWTLVTAVADGENIVLYINDQEVGRTSYDGTLKASGYAPLGIGAKPNDSGTGVASSSQGYLDGCIDDVRIYSWDLTAEDVAKLYNATNDDGAVQPPVETVTYGDVNRDGRVDSSDARMALQAAVSKLTLDEKQKQAADVDGGSTIDSTDARYILQYAVQKIAAFPVEQ